MRSKYLQAKEQSKIAIETLTQENLKLIKENNKLKKEIDELQKLQV
jgi:cell division protein FtsB